jgi:3-phosphoshikimate 1-carboxyvinyltransferase
MKIAKIDRLKGEVFLPGDKSISHRAAIFASMCEGKVRISNFATSADCASTLSCLAGIGVKIERKSNEVIVQGVGKRGFKKPSGPLDCGNSGTTMRLMSGLLAGQAFTSVLIGDESLSKRPMRRVIGPLESMGAKIDSVDGHAPLTITGTHSLTAISYRMPVASAQIKSCLLLAGLNASGATEAVSPPTVLKNASSRNHTELMLTFLGAGIEESYLETEEGNCHAVSVAGDSRLASRDLNVPADVSSAAFFLVAAACLEGSDLILRNVGLNPTRTAVLDVLKRFGARVEVVNEQIRSNEVVGDIRVRGGGLRESVEGNVIRGDVIANLIDEVPILAVFGTQIPGGLEIRDAAELRVKESDRITAVVQNLERMGADVEEFEDGFRVGRSLLKGADIETFHDHRIAMAFSIAGSFAEGETTINGAEWADVSFPGFYRQLFAVAE